MDYHSSRRAERFNIHGYLNSDQHKINAKLGTIASQEAFALRRKNKILVYLEHQKYCLWCNKPIEFDRRTFDFCSQSCTAKKRYADGYINPNKGKSPSIKTRILLSMSCKGKNLGKTHSKESKLKMQLSAKERKTGGYKNGSGRGKRGWYKNFWCDSSWELAFVIWNLEHGISIKRNYKKFPYLWEGKLTHYIPDFIVDGKLVEIKGYYDTKAKLKISLIPDLHVIDKTTIGIYLDYAILKYGKDFIKLYAGEKSNITLSC